jgi:predicted GNAT family acetyltransferase
MELEVTLDVEPSNKIYAEVGYRRVSEWRTIS